MECVVKIVYLHEVSEGVECIIQLRHLRTIPITQGWFNWLILTRAESLFRSNHIQLAFSSPHEAITRAGIEDDSLSPLVGRRYAGRVSAGGSRRARTHGYLWWRSRVGHTPSVHVESACLPERVNELWLLWGVKEGLSVQTSPSKEFNAASRTLNWVV